MLGTASNNFLRESAHDEPTLSSLEFGRADLGRGFRATRRSFCKSSATVCPVRVPKVSDGAVLRKEDFVWSEHDFNDGERENRRVLKRFTKEFKQMAAETPDGLRDAKLLTAALDLALACVKCYELDKADSIYRRCIGECRRRGMPWDIKCIQDWLFLSLRPCRSSRGELCPAVTPMVHTRSAATHELC